MSIDRRRFIRYSAATGVGVATVAAGTGLVSTGLAGAAKLPEPDSRDFAEDYRGRRITGVHDTAGKKHRITIDGKPMAVEEFEMRDEGGVLITAVISSVTHYEPFQLDEGEHRDGLRKLARRAVDQIGDYELSDAAKTTHSH